MIPVILESPYAGHVQRNKAYLQLCIRDCIARGESPYASHQMCTDALDDMLPEERTKGIEASLSAWARFAQRTVVYTDFGISSGMQLGIARADQEQRPVEYRKLPNFEAAMFFTSYDAGTDTPWVELFARERARVRGREAVHGACVLVVQRDRDKPSNTRVLGIEGPKGTGLPGGRVERGETFRVAALRELLEETGLALKVGGVLYALPERTTDNGDIAHGFSIDAADTFGELRSSKEGRPVWLQPEHLVRDREGFPPVRFPVYNEWILRRMGVLEGK